MAERREEAVEMARAAQRMAEAAEKMVEAVVQFHGESEAELLTEEEADRFALAVVHRARGELRRETEAPAPTPDEIEAWAGRREELRHTREEL